MTDPSATFQNGDLVEVATPIPWHDDKPVGTRLLIDSDAYQSDDAGPNVEGPFYDVADPQNRWCGGDGVPASHLRLVQRSADVVPTAKAIAGAMHSALLDVDSDVLSVHEVGEESDDGATLYARGTTSEGVEVTFLVRVGAVQQGGG